MSTSCSRGCCTTAWAVTSVTSSTRQIASTKDRRFAGSTTSTTSTISARSDGRAVFRLLFSSLRLIGSLMRMVKVQVMRFSIIDGSYHFFLAPLKLRPYGAIQMCILLLYYYSSGISPLDASYSIHRKQPNSRFLCCDIFREIGRFLRKTNFDEKFREIRGFA